MFKKIPLSIRSFFLIVMMLFLVLSSATLYAQDDDYYDDYDDDYYDDYYDDDYYDDDYYDDDYYDDDYYDDEYYDYYDDFGDEGYDEDVDARYEVDGIELLGNPTDEHLELWETFVELIPDEWIDGNITYFEVISSSDTSGYVYSDDDDDELFVLGLNVLELDQPRELRHTIIHEFAHILTLNADQIDFSAGRSCPTYELDEGCSDDDSYVFAFYEEFYEDGTGGRNAFVTDYASENIIEDMAESFTYFVLRDRPDGDTVAEEKILFFYDYRDMVEIRDDIRNELD